MDLEKLEQEFHEAKARCVALQQGPPQDESDELMHWVMNTDINPYCIFLDEKMAELTQSIQGLDRLNNIVGHALLDDGAITFIKIGQSPCIVFLEVNDFLDLEDFWDAVKEQDNFAGHKIIPVEREILDCTVSEFIAMTEAKETDYLRRFFLLEAKKNNREEAIKKYQEYSRFDMAWIDEIKAEK